MSYEHELVRAALVALEAARASLPGAPAALTVAEDPRDPPGSVPAAIRAASRALRVAEILGALSAAEGLRRQGAILELLGALAPEEAWRGEAVRALAPDATQAAVQRALSDARFGGGRRARGAAPWGDLAESTGARAGAVGWRVQGEIPAPLLAAAADAVRALCDGLAEVCAADVARLREARRGAADALLAAPCALPALPARTGETVGEEHARRALETRRLRGAYAERAGRARAAHEQTSRELLAIAAGDPRWRLAAEGLRSERIPGPLADAVWRASRAWRRWGPRAAAHALDEGGAAAWAPEALRPEIAALRELRALRRARTAPLPRRRAPAQRMRQIGIELEVELDPGCDARDVRRALEGDGAAWRVEGDQSLDRGVELVSPILGTDLAGLDAACAAAAAHGDAGGETCGLHVHVSADGLGHAELIALACLASREGATLDRLLRRHAARRRYCAPCPVSVARACAASTTENALWTAWYGGDPPPPSEKYVDARYRAINLCAVRLHGTVEFRASDGTTDPQRVRDVVALAVAIVRWARRHPGPAPCARVTATRARTATWLAEIGLDEATAERLLRHWRVTDEAAQ